MKKYEITLYREGGQTGEAATASAEEMRKGTVSVLTVNAALASGSFDPLRAAEISLNEQEGEFCAIRLVGFYWCEPRFGKSLREVPDRTQALLIEKDGRYRFLLATCSTDYKAYLEGGENGLKCTLTSQKSGLDRINGQIALISAEGDDPQAMIRACFSVALELTAGEANLREKRFYPPVLESLGWCTWDALHIHVNEAGILEKIREFKEKKIPVQYVMIDDMWADCTNLNEISPDMDFDTMVEIQHRSSINDFRADPARFPHGLRHTVKLVHDEGLLVGIWYPVQGYWQGVTAGSPLYERVKDCLITLSDGRIVVAPEYEKAKKVYDYFNRYLKECGVDFIKVDCQSCYERYYGEVDTIGNAAHNLQAAVEDSANEIFGGNLINCMGMATECMLNRRSSAVCRVSNDFMPEDAEWFAKNAIQCAYNSLVYGAVYVGDWDMWWTDDGQAKKNGLLRAISGGPIYVSDKTGRSNRSVLEPLITDDGKILRADGACVPVKECLTKDPRASGKPFAVYNRANASVLLAAFHLDASNAPVSGKVDLKQFGFEEEVAVYDYFARKRFVVAADGCLELTLENNQAYRYYVITPLSQDKTEGAFPDKYVFPKL